MTVTITGPVTEEEAWFLDRILDTLEETAHEMALTIRPFQAQPRSPLMGALKAGDDTVLTVVDQQSALVGRRKLQALLPDIPEYDEELGLSGSGDRRYVIYKDPVDGTKLFTFGAATETVILAVYDRFRQQIVAWVCAHPATSRVWRTRLGGPTIVRYYAQRPFRFEECRAWDGPAKQGTLLIDLLRPFAARGGQKQIWSAAGMSRLLQGLVAAGVDINSLGSNGFHQALVAGQGSNPKGVAAALTTAMGFEGDAAGALATINAGGVAQGFLVVEGGHTRRLETHDPLDPLGFDMLLVACNPVWLDRLSQLVVGAFV